MCANPQAARIKRPSTLILVHGHSAHRCTALPAFASLEMYAAGASQHRRDNCRCRFLPRKDTIRRNDHSIRAYILRCPVNLPRRGRKCGDGRTTPTQYILWDPQRLKRPSFTLAQHPIHSKNQFFRHHQPDTQSALVRKPTSRADQGTQHGHFAHRCTALPAYASLEVYAVGAMYAVGASQHRRDNCR